VGGDGGTGRETGEKMKWQGVFGSLVLGEQKKPRTPGGTTISFPNKMRAGCCGSFGFKRVSSGCKLVGARKGEVV
jgi:hypothetical protein